MKLAVLIRDSKGGISRTETGFKKFVQAFPPSNDINTENITHIVNDVIQIHDQHPISITLRYLVNDIRSQPVATYTDVSAWAEKTKYKWWALVIGFLGWATVVTAFVIEYWLNA